MTGLRVTRLPGYQDARCTGGKQTCRYASNQPVGWPRFVSVVPPSFDPHVLCSTESPGVPQVELV